MFCFLLLNCIFILNTITINYWEIVYHSHEFSIIKIATYVNGKQRFSLELLCKLINQCRQGMWWKATSVEGLGHWWGLQRVRAHHLLTPLHKRSWIIPFVCHSVSDTCLRTIHVIVRLSVVMIYFVSHKLMALFWWMKFLEIAVSGRWHCNMQHVCGLK